MVNTQNVIVLKFQCAHRDTASLETGANGAMAGILASADTLLAPAVAFICCHSQAGGGGV